MAQAIYNPLIGQQLFVMVTIFGLQILLTLCYNCHSNVQHAPTIKPNLCATCHSNEHPKDWLVTHKTQVLIGMVCSDCHQPQFCADCHATGKSSIMNLTLPVKS
jgi:hypothetical protein